MGLDLSGDWWLAASIGGCSSGYGGGCGSVVSRWPAVLWPVAAWETTVELNDREFISIWHLRFISVARVIIRGFTLR